MATKSRGKPKTRRTTKKKKPEPLLKQIGALLMRYEVIGVFLVLVSALTLLSLITDSRGSVTSLWIDALDSFVGIGIWGIPFFTGALGLWLIIYAIDQLDNLAWQRPLGFAMMLFALITGASLVQLRQVTTNVGPPSPQSGGGLVGDFFALALRNTIGLGGAWAIVTLLAICGIVVFADRFLQRQGFLLWYWYQDWRDGRLPSLHHELPPEQQTLFQPEDYPPRAASGKMPSWQKWLNWRNPFSGDEPMLPSDLPDGNQASQDHPPANGVKGGTAPTSRPTQQTPARKATPTKLEKPAPAKPNPPDKMPAARIIGGGATEWQPLRLPQLDQVLQSWDRVVDNDDFIRLQGAKIQETLALFGVPVSFEGVNQGPTVTQYLIRPGYEERIVKGELKRTKVKVSKISGLGNDLALALAASSVRIEAPVPGTSYVGVEVPNQSTNTVGLRELMESEAFVEKGGKLKIALGEDVKGNAIVADMAKMPHLLIAGATGAGKSVCINSIISCLLCTHTPESLRMLMIDPKMVELSVYNRVPHLLSPVVTEVDKASAVLYWAVKEMERRYQLCSKANARDLERYNAYLQKRGEKPLPYILVIVDEMADLMMAAPEEVEKYICRLAQMARAVGIHMIIATQRPSVDVITGLIKANFPSRIAFAVSSQTDSRVILDSPGAERLLGKGDMLYMGADGSKLDRMQGTFLSDDEINNVVRYWKGVRVMDERPSQSLEANGLNSNGATDMDVVGGTAANGAAQFEADAAGLDSFSGALSDKRTDSNAPNRTAKHTADHTEGTSRSRTRRSSSERGSQERPALSRPDSGRLDLQATQGGGRASYGAPDEQPTLFEQVEEMRAIDARDDLFDYAIRVVQEEGRGSTSLLQRKLKIGYNRASRLIDQLEAAGIVGPDQGKSQGRAVLTNQSRGNSSSNTHSPDSGYPNQMEGREPAVDAHHDSHSPHSLDSQDPHIIGRPDEPDSDRIWF